MEINPTEERTMAAKFVEMFYSTDKNGRARAYRFERRQFRSFPMTRAAADAAILEGRAVILKGNPMKPVPPAPVDTNDGLGEFNARLVKCYADAEAEYAASHDHYHVELDGFTHKGCGDLTRADAQRIATELRKSTGKPYIAVYGIRYRRGTTKPV